MHPLTTTPARQDDAGQHRTGTTTTDPATDPVTGTVTGAALVGAALGHAALGRYVIPLVPGGKRPAFPGHTKDACRRSDPWCARACRHVGWSERATTDPARIRAAWSRPSPRGGWGGGWFGIGIACGPSGLWVVDLDVPKPGLSPAARARLQERLDQWGVLWSAGSGATVTGADVLSAIAVRAGQPVPVTYTVVTPSGGRHLYFTRPTDGDGGVWGNSAGTVAPLVDTRADGGLVAAPPTTTPAGVYRVEDDRVPIVAPPGWLVEALRPTARPARGPVTVAIRRGGSGPRSGRGQDGPYLAAALRGEWDRVRAVHGADTAPERGRNHTLFVSAIALGQLAAGGALTVARARAELLDAAAPHLGVCADCARDAEATIISGLARGATRPRHLPDPRRTSRGGGA
jgi:hypothetical protein